MFGKVFSMNERIKRSNDTCQIKKKKKSKNNKNFSREIIIRRKKELYTTIYMVVHLVEQNSKNVYYISQTFRTCFI